MRSDIFFVKEDTRYGVNQLKRIGITTEELAIKHGFDPVITTKPNFDKYVEKLVDGGILDTGNTYIGKQIKWVITPLNMLELTTMLSELKDETVLALKSQATTFFEEGTMCDTLGEPHRYDTDKPLDLINLMVDRDKGSDVYLTCTSGDGLKKPRIHTNMQVEDVYQAMLNMGSIKQDFWIKAAEVMTASTAKAVRSIKLYKDNG